MCSTGDANKKRGIALFYVVLVAGVVVIASFAVSRIALKETIFSNLGKQSQQAFYAANSGLECAMYWDLKHAKFSEAFPDFGVISTENMECARNDLEDIKNDQKIDQSGNTHQYEFTISNLNGSDLCADIVVEKTYNNPDIDTKIEVRGRTSCSSAGRAVERAILTNY